MTRNKARDLFDAFELKFSKKEFSESIDKKQGIWTIELKPLLENLPEFNAVRDFVLSRT